MGQIGTSEPTGHICKSKNLDQVQGSEDKVAFPIESVSRY